MLRFRCLRFARFTLQETIQFSTAVATNWHPQRFRPLGRSDVFALQVFHSLYPNKHF